MRLLAALALLLAASAPRAAAAVLPRDAAPLAMAVSLAFGPETWSEVRISTAGPVGDLTRLVKEGFYKRELIALLLIGPRCGKSLKDLAKERRKGARLSALASRCGLDFERLDEAAAAVEEVVDRDYRPRYPERRLRYREEW